jgi:molybdenum cofactor cytidylyltransferase
VKALTPPVHGVILASGSSSRFGHGDKLMARLGGQSVLARTVSAFCQALETVWVVAAPDQGEVLQALRDLDVNVILNPDRYSGQSASLRLGVTTLPIDAPAAVIGVGDQPLLPASTIEALVQSWLQAPAPAVVPMYNGERGNPVLFSRELFAELLQTHGDIGGRKVLRGHQAREIEIEAWWTALDVDTPEDLRLAEQYLVEPR